ncbi:MAG: hypothetical protein P8M01_03920 [Amylibacter sp.]|nr:hypothetical protein [Amylibacter sp.]
MSSAPRELLTGNFRTRPLRKYGTASSSNVSISASSGKSACSMRTEFFSYERRCGMIPLPLASVRPTNWLST